MKSLSIIRGNDMKRLTASFLIALILACAIGISKPVAAEASPTATKTCFVAHNLGDTIPVTGTLYADPKEYDADTPVLLMLHGFSTNRSLWNGYLAGPELAGSMAQEMVQKGYAVLAIDRPAYGESQYKVPLSGYKVSGLTQIDMMHEVVTQLKKGIYKQTTGNCPSGTTAAFGSNRVVMVGHSFASAITMGYATKYHDLAGIIAWGFSNQGSNPNLAVQTTTNFALPILTLSGYGNFYAPGPNGISTQCLNSYYLPNVDSAVYNIVCANTNLLPTPVGEVSSSTLLSQTNNLAIAAKTVGTTKVMLTFGENDNDFPRSGTTGNVQQAEIDYWANNCGCDVSSYIQPNTGHNGMLHRSMPATAKAFDAWLTSRGLGGN